MAMKTALHRVTVHLLIEVPVDENPMSWAGDLCNGILTENMRLYTGSDSCLIDWAFAAAFDPTRENGGYADALPSLDAATYDPDGEGFPYPEADEIAEAASALPPTTDGTTGGEPGTIR